MQGLIIETRNDVLHPWLPSANKLTFSLGVHNTLNQEMCHKKRKEIGVLVIALILIGIIANFVTVKSVLNTLQGPPPVVQPEERIHDLPNEDRLP